MKIQQNEPAMLDILLLAPVCFPLHADMHISNDTHASKQRYLDWRKRCAVTNYATRYAADMRNSLAADCITGGSESGRERCAMTSDASRHAADMHNGIEPQQRTEGRTVVTEQTCCNE